MRGFLSEQPAGWSVARTTQRPRKKAVYELYFSSLEEDRYESHSSLVSPPAGPVHRGTA